MTTDIVRPALVLGILLAAGSYAATKEWQWEVDLPLVPVAHIERTESPGQRTAMETDAETVRPEQIFED